MDEFFKIIDRMMRQSIKKEPLRFDSPNIKECLALLECGWKILDYQGVPKSLNISVIFKNEEQKRSIQLNTREQKIWIAILEKRQELSKNVKSI